MLCKWYGDVTPELPSYGEEFHCVSRANEGAALGFLVTVIICPCTRLKHSSPRPKTKAEEHLCTIAQLANS